MTKPDVDDDWGFGPVIDNGEYEKAQKVFNTPITKHNCDRFGCDKHGNQHDYHEIWDDFDMSQRQRELMFMETVRAKGRYEKELTLLRRIIITATQRPAIALATSTQLTREVMGYIDFDTELERDEYYNYCIGVFNFTEVEPIVPEEEKHGFFDDLEEMGWGFDENGDEDVAWDTDDDEDELTW